MEKEITVSKAPEAKSKVELIEDALLKNVGGGSCVLTCSCGACFHQTCFHQTCYHETCYHTSCYGS
jgi:hypothetical protein